MRQEHVYFPVIGASSWLTVRRWTDHVGIKAMLCPEI